MARRSIAMQVSRLIAVVALVMLGTAGLVKPRRSIGLDGGSTLSIASAATSLTRHLKEREITLDQRREAESLLVQFTRAQMTRHYWGSFATSAVEIGLPTSAHNTMTIQRDDQSTKLWIVPRRGFESYVAVVKRRNNRLVTKQCKGNREQALKPFSGDCPNSWTAIELMQSES